MLDTDPGFIGSVCSVKAKANPKWGVVCGRDGGDGWMRMVAKFFAKKMVDLPVVDRNSMAGMVLI